MDKNKELINNLTQDIIRMFQIKHPIKDMTEIIEQMQGRVIEVKNVSRDYNLVTKENDKYGFSVYISKGLPQDRKNLILAESLGVLFIKMRYMIDDDFLNQQTTASIVKGNTVAEYCKIRDFANAFLMPEQIYKQIFRENTYLEGSNIKVKTGNIADFFYVSIDAVASRGKFLECMEVSLF